MPSPEITWDFFIAHAGADKTVAETLFDLLTSDSRVFLDSRNLRLGDDWDAELAAAQKAALVTVVLVSSKTDKAYYQREEIAAAVDLARKSAHRVVPIFLSGDSTANPDVPYGLRLKHGLHLSTTLTIQSAARQLLDLLDHLRTTPSALGTASDAAPEREVDLEIDGRSRQARGQIDTLVDQLQVALNQGVVDRDAAMRKMEAILTLVREAQHDARLDTEALEKIYRRGSQAGRLVALSIADESLMRSHLPMALEAISRPLSPWEQYLGLRAIYELVPHLSKDEKNEVHAAIVRQQGGGAGAYIVPQNEGRWRLANRILMRLNQ